MTAIAAFAAKAWGLLKAGAKWLLETPVALAALAGVVFGAFFMWRSSKNKINRLEDAVAVKATLNKVAKDEARAQALKESADAKDEEVKALEGSIAASKRRVAEIHEEKRLEDKSDEEVARIFADSGL